MIDDDDVDTFSFLSLFNEGPWGWIFLVIALVLWVIASQNSEECSKKTCPTGKPVLTDHKCYCMEEAK